MLQNVEEAKQHSEYVRQLVDRWLEERRELITLLCQLGGLHQKDNRALADDVLQQFCQILVDYVSAGHFEVYEHMVSQCEQGQQPQGLALIKKVYPDIVKTTDVVLNFSDSYAKEDEQVDELADEDTYAYENLVEDLSGLAEAITTRFELEDRLICTLYA